MNDWLSIAFTFTVICGALLAEPAPPMPVTPTMMGCAPGIPRRPGGAIARNSSSMFRCCRDISLLAFHLFTQNQRRIHLTSRHFHPIRHSQPSTNEEFLQQ